MNGALDTSPLSGSRAGAWVVCAFQLYDIACFVFDDLLALYDIGVFEADLSVRLESEELLRSVFHEVRTVNQQLSCERNFACRSFRLGRVERAVKPLYLTFRIIGDGDLDRVLNHHVPVGPCVQVLTYAPFEKLDVYELVSLGNTDLVAEHLQCICRISSSAHAAECRHSRVVPS